MPRPSGGSADLGRLGALEVGALLAKARHAVRREALPDRWCQNRYQPYRLK